MLVIYSCPGILLASVRGDNSNWLQGEEEPRRDLSTRGMTTERALGVA